MDTPFVFGAIPRPVDTRDYHLGSAQPAVQIPDSYFSDLSNVSVKMQGKLPTCGGHAGSTLASYLNKSDLSPKFLWKKIKQIDNSPLSAGTDMRSILATLKDVGDCQETLDPDVLDDTIEAYSALDMTPTQVADASAHQISAYAFIDRPTMDEIKQAIFQNGSVIALVDCCDTWWINGWGADATVPVKPGNVVSGHFIVLYGYDNDFIYFRNSWSKAWGANGNSMFGADYLPLVREIGTAIPSIVSPTPVTPEQAKTITILQRIIALLKQIIALKTPITAKMGLSTSNTPMFQPNTVSRSALRGVEYLLVTSFVTYLASAPSWTGITLGAVAYAIVHFVQDRFGLTS